jgi:hypothetical protein
MAGKLMAGRWNRKAAYFLAINFPAFHPAGGSKPGNGKMTERWLTEKWESGTAYLPVTSFPVTPGARALPHSWHFSAREIPGS